MNNQSTAQVLPVQTLPQSRAFQVHRPRPQKPLKKVYHNLKSEFSAETAKKMLQSLFPDLANIITKKTIVTCQTDETGVNMVFSGKDFNLSIIYNEIQKGEQS